MIRYLLLLVFNIYFQMLSCQYDTIIRYSIDNENVDYIVPPLVYDSLILNANTGSQIGTITNFTFLFESISEQTFENSNFTDLTLASDYFNVSDYPISTAVKLAYLKSDTLKPRCSGLLIANDLVLTAAHCVFSYKDRLPEKVWKDNLIAYPAFDHGNENIEFNISVATDYFIFNSWYKRQKWDDLAIIKLQYPIGIKTGWLGIGFNQDTTFLSNEIFHTLSYPGTTSWFDSTKVYNGDSLYYKYGQLKRYDKPDYLTIGVPGIPGESGSSIIYTDNNKLAYSLGILSFGSQSDFYKINKNNYPALEYIVKNFGSTTLNLPDTLDQNGKMYPVPFSEILNIESPPLKKLNSITVYNQLGQIIFKQININNTKYRLDGSKLNAGLYLISVKFDDNKITLKKVVKL